MREIKFRAWHETMKEWCYTGNYHRNLFMNEFGEWIARFDRGMADMVDCRPKIIFQFTGLHDRNGKEIYEGDIVSSPHFKDRAGRQHELLHIVQWSERHRGWFLLSKASMDPKDGSIQLFVADNAGLTVSGTIHD